MKLRIGNTVKIKSIEKIRKTIKSHQGPGFETNMYDYCDKYAKVIAFHDIHPDKWVFLDIDNKSWVWDERWLEKQLVMELNDNLFEL